jgi:hypothetical protein
VSVEEFETREPGAADLGAQACGHGRELFEIFRANVGAPERGAGVFA